MMIYLDNSATTQPCPEALNAVTEAYTDLWQNPSALYRPAMEVQKRVNEVRGLCLKAAGASGQKLVFTGSGTEADNMALIGWLRGKKKPGRVFLSSVEHPAILACSDEIRRMGHRVELIPVDHEGCADLNALEKMILDGPESPVYQFALMQVNNESGAIQPVSGLAALRDRLCPEAAIHVDGVQGFLRVPIDFNRSGIQSYAFSGHKIHACKGIGGLIFRKDHKLSPIVFGGGQEDGYRSGTENVPGIFSLGAAVKAFPADAAEEMKCRKAYLWDRLKKMIPEAVLNGPAPESDASSPHILNVSFTPVRSQTLLFALEGDGIFVSAGSACSSRKQKVSDVLTAMGLTTAEADCAIRFSLCPGITEADLDKAAEAVACHYQLLKKYVRR